MRAKGRATAGPQHLSSSASDASGATGSSTVGDAGGGMVPPSDDEGGDGGGGGGCSGCVNPETDSGLARGVMAHVMELLR